MPPLLRALSPGLTLLRQNLPGVMVAAALAAVAQALARELAEGVAGLPRLPSSPVLWAVLLGMVWRNTLGVPAWCTEGLNWTMHGLLRTGIALVGLRLTFSGAGEIAVTAAPVAIACIVVALLVAAGTARLLHIPLRFATLLGVGTAVCGCTAVVALSPVIRARHIETVFAVTCIVLFGCMAMLCYPWIAHHYFAASPASAGIFLGTAIHDTSQVVGAALIYTQQTGDPDALSAASVAKLLRNMSMAVLIPAAAWLAARKGAEGAEASGHAARAMPFFVVAFVALIGLRTVGDRIFGPAHDVWISTIEMAGDLSQLLLTCGMTAVGLSVCFSQMRSVGWRPLAASLVIALAVGVCSLVLTLSFTQLVL